MLQIRPVTRENLDEVLTLRVHESQRAFVSTTAESLAEAYVYGDTAFPFAVYDDETIIGFIMMGYYEAKDYYTLWKLLIDEKYQGRGYGRRALEQGLLFLKERFNVSTVYTGVAPGNTVAKSLYLSMGFVETGIFENNMEELRKGE
ncbi:MAG: GNAT family N-acetyltransferase [Lachnospiraceae bacterium]|nr:GNAT family N-acetyltransferase [Lachnospiraceae bacterium]